MTQYDESKDKLLDSRDIKNEDGNTGHIISLMQYNMGDIKVQIQPYYINKDGKVQYTKGKRIKLSLFPVVYEAIQDMESKLKF